MTQELEHIPQDLAALRWAAGCVWVSYRERMNHMNAISTKLPRWLLSLEMALCLVPMTLMFVNIVAYAARGIMPLADLLRFGTVALIGPLASLLALRVLFFSRRPVSPGLFVVAALLAAWTLFAYLGELLHNGTVPFMWREYVLIALLPALAVAHLAYINAARRTACGVASSATGH